MGQLTLKDHFRIFIEYLEFLSNRELCFKSWVEGSGPFSSGYKEEINSIASYGFFDSFPDKIDNYKISKNLKEDLINFIFDFNSELRNLPSKITDEDLLINENWIKLTDRMKILIEKMNRELNSISSDRVDKCFYKTEFQRLVKHLEILSDRDVCFRSWFHCVEPFSLGSEMEFNLIESNIFFNINDKKLFKVLKFSEEFHHNFIEIRNTLKTFISENRFRLVDLDLLENKEWQIIADKLKEYIPEMKDQLKIIPGDKLVKPILN